MGLYRGPQITTNGLVLYVDAANYKSHDGNSTTWNDLTGNGLNATMEDGDSFNSEGWMRLNGSTDAFQFGSDSLIETQTLTLNAWINLEDRGDRHILLTNWYGWSYEIASDRRPYLRLHGSGAGGDLYSTEYITWGKWHMITATYNGIGNDRTIALDGVINNTIAGSSITGNIAYDTQYSFNIPYTHNPAYALGKIAMVQYYNRALSADEILNIYEATKTRFEL